MKKKFLLTVLALTMVSCGETSTSTPNTSTNTSGGGKEEISSPWWENKGNLKFDDNNKVIFEDIDIDLATVVNGEDIAALNNIINQFNAEHKGKITVSVTNIGQDTFEQTVSSQISTNTNAPDLIMKQWNYLILIFQ